MPKKILVIDDEELLIKSMNRLLEKEGYQVYTAKNGVDAEVMIEEEDFNLIICDIRMPGRDGVETVKVIQKAMLTNNRKQVPIVFISGFADEHREKEARDLKPIAYLAKPFDIKEMLQLIRATD